MSYTLGLVIEGLVAILLLVTISYCVILNNRLKRLRADEQSLRATISELITATEIAERAVADLKTTAQECDKTLGNRLRGAERVALEMGRQIKAGEEVLDRLTRIVSATRPPGAPAEGANSKAMVDAAHKIAERTRALAVGLAA
jgi:hypothetical protein